MEIMETNIFIFLSFLSNDKHAQMFQIGWFHSIHMFSSFFPYWKGDENIFQICMEIIKLNRNPQLRKWLIRIYWKERKREREKLHENYITDVEYPRLWISTKLWIKLCFHFTFNNFVCVCVFEYIHKLNVISCFFFISCREKNENELDADPIGLSIKDFRFEIKKNPFFSLPRPSFSFLLYMLWCSSMDVHGLVMSSRVLFFLVFEKKRRKNSDTCYHNLRSTYWTS